MCKPEGGRFLLPESPFGVTDRRELVSFARGFGSLISIVFSGLDVDHVYHMFPLAPILLMVQKSCSNMENFPIIYKGFKATRWWSPDFSHQQLELELRNPHTHRIQQVDLMDPMVVVRWVGNLTVAPPYSQGLFRYPTIAPKRSLATYVCQVMISSFTYLLPSHFTTQKEKQKKQKMHWTCWIGGYFFRL